MKKPPKILNRIVDKVLAYHPAPKTKHAEKRQEKRNGSHPSRNQGKDEKLKLKAKLILKKTSDIFYDNLNDYEYGMTYADENILKAILKEMVELDITTPGKIMKVLQFLPQND